MINIPLMVSIIAGAVIGSLINMFINQISSGKPLATISFKCSSCLHKLSFFELVPFISYLLQKGHCRYCQAKIPIRSLWVELGTAMLVGFAYLRYGISLQFALFVFYSCIFIILGVIDLERKLILNKIVFPAAIIVLIIDFHLPYPGIVSSIVGGVLGFILLMLPAIFFRGKMGWGDVKMAALIGFVTGFSLAFITLAIGILLGGLTAAILLVFKIKKRQDLIPFGPFLSIATIITLLYGNSIFNWYIAFFGKLLS